MIQRHLSSSSPTFHQLSDLWSTWSPALDVQWLSYEPQCLLWRTEQVLQQIHPQLQRRILQELQVGGQVLEFQVALEALCHLNRRSFRKIIFQNLWLLISILKNKNNISLFIWNMSKTQSKLQSQNLMNYYFILNFNA